MLGMIFCCEPLKSRFMLIYNVTWTIDKSLSKGKGKVTSRETYFSFSVLCNSSKDANACLEWYFYHVFFDDNKHHLTLDDGTIHMSRSTVDSRGFYPNYLFIDNMRMPLSLSDIKGSLFQYVKFLTL